VRTIGADTGSDGKVSPVRIYIFKSETNKLQAFASDPAGAKLPKQHGPWTVIGIVAPGSNPPHNISRVTVEKAIESEGFQLWRITPGGKE
jgi:hypothetical protein